MCPPSAPRFQQKNEATKKQNKTKTKSPPPTHTHTHPEPALKHFRPDTKTKITWMNQHFYSHLYKLCGVLAVHKPKHLSRSAAGTLGFSNFQTFQKYPTLFTNVTPIKILTYLITS